MQENIVNTRDLYYTWDIFRKDLELNLGHFLPNNVWLQVKPRKPLPWLDSDLKVTLEALRKQRAVARISSG
jgi:hypothetical protein